MTILYFIQKKLGLKRPVFISWYCRGKGIEIGGSAQMDFKLNAINVDRSDHILTEDVYTKEQMQLAGHIKPVDLIANGDNLPLKSNSVDFVFSSHVIEHFYDPVSAIEEWLRVVKPGGYVVMLVPHKERTFESESACTSIEEFVIRHQNYNKNMEYQDKHYSVWTTETFLQFAKYFKYNVVYYINMVYKAENSFGIVIKKQKP